MKYLAFAIISTLEINCGSFTILITWATKPLFKTLNLILRQVISPNLYLIKIIVLKKKSILATN